MLSIFRMYKNILFTASKTAVRLSPSVIRMSGDLGSGAGKGGGGGGSIRNAGGAFGVMEAVHEEQYFYNKQKELLRKLRSKQIEHKIFHIEKIKEHEAAIRRHKEVLEKYKNN